MANEQTNTKNIPNDELDKLLNLAGPGEVLTVDAPENMFRKPTEADIDFTAKKPDENKPAEKPASEPAGDKQQSPTAEEIEASLKLGEGEQSDGDQGENNENKVVPSVEVIDELIKRKIFEPFDDDKPIKDYTKKEILDLVEANIKRIREDEAEKAPAELFDVLPEDFQKGLAYVLKGGTDIKGLYKALLQTHEIKDLDIKTEVGQEQTIRQWLGFTGQTPSEIDEEITSLKDMPGALEKKANVYKPKLDAKAKEIVEQQIKAQEEFAERQKQAAANYRENVLAAIQPADLDGIKLTPSVQNKLFSGLVDLSYQSQRGQPTNLFGHLLETHQYLKPNPKLMAEVLWLMSDRDAYRKAVQAAASKEETEKTLRTLKGAKQDHTAASSEASHSTKQQRGIPRPKRNIFEKT